MIGLSFDVEPDFPPYYDTNLGIDGLRTITGILRERKADATFFVCADFLEKNPSILELMKGFELGCHGLRHVDLTKLSGMHLEGEVLEAVECFEEYGLTSRGFRAPYAQVNLEVLGVLSKYFEYDSSLLFYQKKPNGVDMREVPIYTGGKMMGISPALFGLTLKTPVKDKVYFAHPWEFGGMDFKLIEGKRRKMKVLGYARENYARNLETLLRKKPVRLSELL
jgi:peptidoglycan/xylan/chitin deacetylase (PgdA/CDA1 family)